MYKIIKLLVLIIWLVDILNIDFIAWDIHVAEFLDKTIPINFWFWLLFWLLAPTTQEIVFNKEI